jgi:hypothetical protein
MLSAPVQNVSLWRNSMGSAGSTQTRSCIVQEELAIKDQRLARVVETRFFGGLAEAAAVNIVVA